ncbi:MAG: carbohydrate ABC transporter permease [Thermomicrobium sp.]|jgi:sn-glycerol 3-phosphate transport system permease protein|uniref:carbohydrate ABC transporter permease n=1 Tax=Thermomicrobium sp. TaxID=1969469 RepID=UPI001AFD14CE|nr:carbohydrate ABC transporter permease [Thermomicrobium sp.]MBO9351649.1 carbohydrate ABC transporter permease [Thermomicrobium sp.]
MTERRNWRRSIATGLRGLLVGLVVVLMGLPLYWVATGALKTNQEIYTFPPVWIPRQPQWGNFVEAWQAVPFGRFFVNSIVTTLGAVALELLFALLSAYALVFVRARGKGLVFAVVIAALLVPGTVTLLPNYLTVGRLGWINTYQGLIIPVAAVAFGVFLFRQHFLTLPRDLLDAARLDGCGHLGLLRHVVLPLSQPVIVTFLVIYLVAHWNDFLWPLVVTNRLEWRTVPVGVAYLYQVEGVQNWGPILAGTVMALVPMLLVYVVAQRWIVKGIGGGALKG